MSAAFSCTLIPWVSRFCVCLLGLVTGSFLNAVIHRLPRGMSLLHPRRSFCPDCGKTIPWYENLPVASWVFLRGRCSGCSMPIMIRYPLVELLSAGFYLLVWDSFGLPLAPVFWLFFSLLLSSTFIDLEHLIIPDEITIGGIAAGLLCSTLLPELLGNAVWWQGLLSSLLGATAGFFLLWGVVEIGKIAFGRRKITPECAMSFEITSSDGELILTIGEETMPLLELFYRPSDSLEVWCEWLDIRGEMLGEGRLFVGSGSVRFGERVWQLDEPDQLIPMRAGAIRLILPREAMGFGDVKFLACIGAFLGWKGMLFSLFAGSLIGALCGLVMIAIVPGRAGSRIPFGPYLALGAAFWVFWGVRILDFYMAWAAGENSFFLSPTHPPM